MGCRSRRLHLLSRSRQMTLTHLQLLAKLLQVLFRALSRSHFQWSRPSRILLSTMAMAFLLLADTSADQPRTQVVFGNFLVAAKTAASVHDFVRNWERPNNAASGMGGGQSAVRTSKPSTRISRETLQQHVMQKAGTRDSPRATPTKHRLHWFKRRSTKVLKQKTFKKILQLAGCAVFEPKWPTTQASSTAS